VVLPDSAKLGHYVFDECNALLQKAASAGFDSVELYLRDRYKCVTLRKLFLRLLGKYNQAVNEADGTEDEKHAIALAYFPTDNNSSTLYVGPFLRTMSTSVAKLTIALANFPTDNCTSPAIGHFLQAMSAEVEKQAIALAYFPTDNSSTLDVGLFLQTMNASGGDGVKGLVGYILKFL